MIVIAIKINQRDSKISNFEQVWKLSPILYEGLDGSGTVKKIFGVIATHMYMPQAKKYIFI